MIHTEYDLILMSLVIFVPTLFALALLFFPRRSEEYMRWWSLLGTTVTLVLSLWDVHDKSTKEFMLAFYSRLQAGSSKPEALRAAMLQLRESNPHPYYWAPFSLIGKD